MYKNKYRKLSFQYTSVTMRCVCRTFVQAAFSGGTYIVHVSLCLLLLLLLPLPLLPLLLLLSSSSLLLLLLLRFYWVSEWVFYQHGKWIENRWIASTCMAMYSMFNAHRLLHTHIHTKYTVFLVASLFLIESVFVFFFLSSLSARHAAQFMLSKAVVILILRPAKSKQ